jgi:hypothetical protein
MATSDEIRDRLIVRQDVDSLGGVARGVAQVYYRDRRVGMLVYVDELQGWDAFQVTPEGRYRKLDRSPIDGFVGDWEACAQSALPELANRLAG